MSSGTLWNVTFNGVTQSSTTTQINFIGYADGNYPYLINTPNGYTIGTASSGTITVSGANVNKSVTFASLLGTDWPEFHHDIANTGYSTTTGPLTNQTLWNYTTGNAVLSSPAVADGVVYVGSKDNKVYALNASSGVQIWNYITGDDVSYSSPAVVDGVVYVGSYDGKVYAFGGPSAPPEYTLTMNTVGQGSVSPGNQTYPEGAVANLTATSAAGWTFSGWSGDASGTANTTLTMDGNKTVVATFTQDIYTLTMYTVGDGQVSPGNSTSYHYGDTVDIKAMNAVGWTFAGWSGASTATTNTTLTMTGNLTVTATFSQNNYTLTMVTVGQGSVSPGNATYSAGAVANLTATPAAGWTFSGWSGEDLSGTADTTITMNSNMTVTATFTQDNYMLTVVTAGNGTVNYSNQTFLSGTNVTLIAAPEAGWSFGNWTGDVTGTDNPAYVVMDDNKTVTATFAQNTYYLTVIIIGGGVVSEGNQTYSCNETVQLRSKTSPGWSFAGWSGDASGTDTRIEFTMDSNKTVTATFTQNTYTLNVEYVGQGHVDLNVTGPYVYGQAVNLTAVADQGWSFADWSDELGTSNPLTLEITSNSTVTATFVKNTYIITINIDGHGAVNRNATETYEYSQGVNLTAVPQAGWSFSGWSSDASGTDNPITVVTTSNMTITATFTQDVYSLTVVTVGS
ncbi:MAG: InlB B-repeat-containing protein, partial [Candidatus Bathyarchaeota archaeon]|nr:InlB B-repeat-containing protein [Candidatus Bathyarchaeota archaeon]